MKDTDKWNTETDDLRDCEMTETLEVDSNPEIVDSIDSREASTDLLTKLLVVENDMDCDLLLIK